MALYKNTGNALQRGQSQMESAQATWGQRTKENQTTEYEPGRPSGMQVAGQAMGLLGLPGQLEGAWNNLNKGVHWLTTAFGAPDTAAQAANAGTGAADLTGGGVQLNTGAQAGNGIAEGLAGNALNEEELAKTFYYTPEESVSQIASGSLPETTGGVAAQSGVQATPTGLSSMGTVVAPAIGGAVGGYAGKQLGKAIGGDTGATIGGLAGSLGGAYLGGMAGAAGAGAAAGATAGSAVPGLGTVIGAGIGALTSFLL